MEVILYINRIYKRIVRIFLGTIFALFGIVITSFLLLQHPKVQNYVADKIVHRISNELDTKVTVSGVDIGFFNITLNDFYLEDHQQDTLVFANSLTVKYDAFKLLSNKIDLKNLAIDGATVNLRYRENDTSFNYQFIADAFAGNDTSAATVPDWKIDLKKIRLSNVNFEYLDVPVSFKLNVSVKDATVDIHKVDLIEEELIIDKVFFDQAIVKQYDLKFPDRYETTEVFNDGMEIDINVADDIFHLNTTSWVMLAKEIRMKDSRFERHNQNFEEKYVESAINLEHMKVNDINMVLSNTFMYKDTIETDIHRMSFRERSGFKVSQLEARAKISTNKLVFDKLFLETDQSVIRDHISFSYHSLPDFYDFVNKVRLNSSFDKSMIAMEDLEYFVPNIPHMTSTYFLDGELKGTVSDLRGKDISVQIGNVTRFVGNFNIMNLPNIEETLVDLSVENFTTNKWELETLIPDLYLPPESEKLGNITFTGNFTGFLHDFVAYGDFNTNLGRLSSDINMKLNEDGTSASYSGNLSATNFNLSKWLNEPEMLGHTSFNVALNGEGLQWETLQANLTGKVNHLDFNGYRYENIDVVGVLQRRFFSGSLLIDDDNLAMTFAGKVDFQPERPIFNLITHIDHADLQALNFIDQHYQVAADVHLDFQGSNINNIEGKGMIVNAAISSPVKTYELDSVIMTSFFVPEGKQLILKSEIVDFVLKGKYNTTQITYAFSNLIHHYYPSFPTPEYAGDYKEDFTFSLNIKETNKLTEIFIPAIKGEAGTTLTGKFNSANQLLILDGFVPGLEYDKVRVENLHLSVNTRSDTLSFHSRVDELIINDQFYAPRNEITGNVHNDIVNFDLKISSDTLPNRLVASATLYNEGDSLMMRIKNSKVILADKEWKIDDLNRLVFHQSNIYAHNLTLENNTQRIIIESNPESVDVTDLMLDMKNVELSDMTSVVNFNQYALSGLINGHLELKNLTAGLDMLYGNFTIQDFTFENENYGQLDFNTDFNPANQKLNINATLKGENSQLSILGFYQENHPSRESLHLNITVHKTPFNILEPFLEGVASNLEGEVSGKIGVGGRLNAINLNGNLMLNNGAVLIDYLNTTYTIDPVEVTLSKHSIFINQTRIFDKNGRTADIGGEIGMVNFEEMSFEDFYVYTSDNFLFMETTSQHNELFYGKAFGRGIVLINGPFDDINIYVNAKSDPGSQIFIPISYESSVSQYDFVRFVQSQADSILEAERYKLGTYGVEMNMDLDITPDAEVQLIFDLKAGDIIKGRGNGNLKMHFNTYGDFNMYGNYIITEGSYLFTMQDFINKNFKIEEGSSILWTGDPYEARLDINAIYRTKAARYDLVMDQAETISEEEKKDLRQPVPVEVILHLTEQLSAPEIGFDIRLPNVSSTSFAGSFDRRFRQVKTDENELNKQVFGLIVFNRFMPNQLAPQGGGMVSSAGATTMTEFLTNQLSLYFTDWLSKYDVEINLQYHSYELGNEVNPEESLYRNELELELSKKFGRFALNVGGNYDFGGTNEDVTRASNLAGDFAVEYSLTEDGRIRVKAFGKSEYDIFTEGYRNKTGVGVFYKKEFDNFRELFTSPDKDKETAEKKKEEKKSKEGKKDEGHTMNEMTPASPTIPLETTAEKEKIAGSVIAD